MRQLVSTIDGRGQPYAIFNDNTSMSIDNVQVTALYNGIKISGALAHASISNCKVIISNNDGAAYGITVANGSNVFIQNCAITLSANGETLGVCALSNSMVSLQGCIIDVRSVGHWVAGVTGYYGGAKVTVRDSIITSEGGSSNYGVDNEGITEIIVSNTKIKVTGPAGSRDNVAVWAGKGTVNVTNSEIEAAGSSLNCAAYSSNAKIGGSLIIGNYDSLCGTPTIVNSWDENFIQIPNQFPNP